MLTFIALFGIYIVIVPSAFAATCDQQWTLYRDDKYCIRYFADLKARNDAETDCNNLNGQLVTIQNAFENSQVKQLKGDEKVHIGLKYDRTTNSFIWPDNTNPQYTNLVPNFNTRTDNYGTCVGMGASGKWTNVDCTDETLGYVCIKDVDNVVAANTCPDPDESYMNRGTISSPTYPNNYAVNLDCSYTLSAKSSHTISVTIDDLVLGDNDQLVFYNGYTAQAKSILACFKGNTVCNDKPAQTTFESTAHIVRVAFTSQGTGKWKFTWHGVPDDVDPITTNQCPSPTYVYRESGTINSPAYPQTYSNNNDCTYLLSAAHGYKIKLSFPTLTLPNGDYIELYENSLIAAKSPFASTSNNGIKAQTLLSIPYSDVKVVFHSGTIGGGKWSLVWSSMLECPTNVFTTSGQIQSPGYPSSYQSLMRCTYNLRTAYGGRISINFNEINMDSASDIIKIYEGWSQIGTPVVISGSKKSFQYNSTTNQVMLIFTSGSLQQPWYRWSATFSTFYGNL
uniref:Deleted in malignant brain tumors 1 protein n=1 Tax=Syphacia muris TaxID=451379 RepID=A0A0N5AUD8_9BILA